MNASNKRPVETFLVASADSAMPSSGTLMNSSTGAVNLSDGQLGVISSSIYGSVAMNTFLADSTNISEAPVITFVQGTANSANPGATSTYPLWTRAYEMSSPIDGRKNVYVTKQTYRSPEHSVWCIGNAVGETDAVNILDNTEYEVAVGFRGYRVEDSYSCQEASYLRAKVTTPDFTDLGYSDAQATDWILTKLAWEINRNSQAFSVNSRFPNKGPILALLIDTTGDDGTPIGGVDPITAGDVISVVTTSSGLKNITLTEELATSIKDAAIAATGDVIADVTWSILTVDLADAGSSSGGLGDVLMLVGLDEPTAFVDWIPQVKVRLEVSIPSGFDYTTVRYSHDNFPDEGQGTSRQLDLLYKATQGQRKYNLRHTQWPIVEFPSPIESGEQYNVYAIRHANHTQVDTFNLVDSQFVDYICIPTSFETLDLDSTLESWLESTPSAGTIITLN